MFNTCLRQERMAEARKLGNHTKAEWEDLKDEFLNTCVRCGLIGYHLEKDHIKPVYQGGSDSIENIQPLCAWCNSSKGPEKFNWKEFRRKKGWIETNVKLSKHHPLKVNLPKG